MNDSFTKPSLKRKKSPSIRSSTKQKRMKLDDASSIVSLTRSMAYGISEEYSLDDDLMSVTESEKPDNNVSIGNPSVTTISKYNCYV